MNSLRRYAPPPSRREAYKVPLKRGMSTTWTGGVVLSIIEIKISTSCKSTHSIFLIGGNRD
jgi:hypothetical protein